MSTTQFTLENVSTLERKLAVSIPKQPLEDEIVKRLKKIQKTAKVNGFRVGKVPFTMIKEQYDFSVRNEVFAGTLESEFNQYLKDNSISVAGEPVFNAERIDTNVDTFNCTITFEVFPEVKVGDATQITIEKPVLNITDAEVDKTIDILRKQRATYQPAGRTAQNEDQVKIDFTGRKDGVEFDGGKAEGYSVVLGAKRLLEDFETAIIGKNVGDNFRFNMTFPADYHATDLAGQEVEFEITLHEINAPTLPEITEDFAKQLGVADGSIEALRAEIKQNLELEAKRRTQMNLREQATKGLLEVTDVEVPKSLAKLEKANLIQHAREDLQRKGINPDQMPDADEMFENESIRRVKIGLVLTEVVKENNLQATGEQIRAKIEEFSQSFEDTEAVIGWYYSNPERLREVEALVIDDNIVEWVLTKAQVTEKTAEFDDFMGQNA